MRFRRRNGGTSDGARCCRCAVDGALLLFSRVDIPDTFKSKTYPVARQKTMRTRHATDPPAVPMVERDAEGGGGGDLTGGPLDGQTNRESNPRPRRAPAMAHTTRPSMPLTQYGA